MKNSLFAVFFAICCQAAFAEVVHLEYDIQFKNKSVGTQKVTIERANDDLINVKAESSLEVRVMLIRYTFSDTLNATFKNGRVQKFNYSALDDGKPIELIGNLTDGELRIAKKEKGKKTDIKIAADAYDLHSWSMYLDPELSFADKAGAIRILLIDEGVVDEQRIVNKGDESVTVEDKSFKATRIDWARRKYTNSTWHTPERQNVPLRFVYEDENGQTVFVLKSMRR